MSLFVYVAAPYASAAFVRQVIHENLVAVGIVPTSTWAIDAHGREDFSRYTPESLRAARETNLRDIRRSDALFLYDPTGEGHATYGEGELAVEWKKAVVWYSPKGITQWANEVERARDLDHAIELLALRARSAA